jgi:hypothetical protein
MSAALERRYRRLMWVYPSNYRADRDGEMLDTLLASTASGRTWPPPRDCWALIAGGLRVRAVQNRRLSTATNMRLSIMLGLAFLLADAMGATIFSTIDVHGVSAITDVNGSQLVTALAVIAVAVSAWFLRPRFVIAAASTVALLVVFVHPGVSNGGVTVSVPPALGLIVLPAVPLLGLALLTLGTERLPRPWLGFVGAAVLWPLCDLVPMATRLLHHQPPEPVLLAAAVVLWMLVDARPAIAATVFLVFTGTVLSVDTLIYVDGPPGYVGAELLIAAVALLVPSAWRLRRQAVL